MESPSETPAGTDRTPLLRPLVIGMASLSSFLLYLDRVCISILGAYIPEELRLSPSQWAWVLGAFFYTYALGQVPSGWLGDRFGPRRMLTLWIIAWSACTAATGLAGGFVLLLLARLACGLTQSGAYPTSAILMRHWVPVMARGKANSFVTLGGRLGALVAPSLTAFLVVALLPRDASNQIAPGDLLDAPRIGRALTEPGKDAASAFRQTIHDRLSAEELASAQRLVSAKDASTADVEVIRAGLNRLLADRGLGEHLGNARSLLPREGVAALEVPSDRRSPAQTERLNRLALEVAFPKAIRQIYGQSWRLVLVLYGAVGLVVALLFWTIVRDRPPVPHAPPAVVEAASNEPEPTTPTREPSIFWLLFSNRNLWLIGMVQFGINIGWAFLITLLPNYLAEVYHVPLEERGRMQSVPIFVGCFGMFAGGFLTDRLARLIGFRWGRSVPIILTSFACAGALFLCPWLPSAWAVVAALSFMAAMVDLGVPSTWAFVQDVGGRNAGAALGWGNMWGNFGAALSPVVLSRIEQLAGWNSAFAASATAFLLAGIAGIGMDATKPLRTK